jgi:hypothetical protein
MNKQNTIEDRLWDYIDGYGSREERSDLEQLLESNLEWKEKYRELLEVHHMLHSSELQEPSMRFTKNVMEEIAKYHIAPATKTYINKKIIWGIGLFFITLIVGFLIYGFSQVDWSAANSTSNQYIDLSKVDYSKIFNNTYVNVFMMLNAVLGLMLLDRYLADKRKTFKKEM